MKNITMLRPNIRAQYKVCVRGERGEIFSTNIHEEYTGKAATFVAGMDPTDPWSVTDALEILKGKLASTCDHCRILAVPAIYEENDDLLSQLNVSITFIKIHVLFDNKKWIEFDLDNDMSKYQIF